MLHCLLCKVLGSKKKGGNKTQFNFFENAASAFQKEQKQYKKLHFLINSLFFIVLKKPPFP